LVAGYWLLVTGCWFAGLLVTGYWLLVAGLERSLFETHGSPFGAVFFFPVPGSRFPDAGVWCLIDVR